jgi:arabinofuranan 3-O-arabinosyltransferase
VATDDGSPGVQFGITDLAVTQYDANGFAHPVNLRHTVAVPGPPPGSAVAQWDLGSELLGRPGCAHSPDGIRCAATMALSPEEPVNLSRTLTVPEPIAVTPTVWVRARQGPNLADLIRAPGSAIATGDADPIDVLGSAYAAADGDPDTAWTARQGVVQHKSPPTLTLRLPTPREVAAVRVSPSSSELPAHPTLVAVDLGDGPQVRRLIGDAGQTLELKPRVTDTVKISILDWEDIIDRTALGFDQLKPPGLAEVTMLDPRGVPIAAADAARNRDRTIELPCGRGPIIGVAGQFIQTSIDTTVAALLDGEPIAARPCQAGPIALPAGVQELLISPGTAFTADGVQLDGPLADRIVSAATVPAKIESWSADHREVKVAASAASRVLVVPESMNPGWIAHDTDGTQLTPVTVNGWQQGWVLPPGTEGPVTTSAAALAVGAVISGLAGVIVVALCLGVRHLLRNRERLCDAVTVTTTAGGLILAGAVLSQNPWRSVDGYVGHSVGVQLLALISVAMLAASVVPTNHGRFIATDPAEP